MSVTQAEYAGDVQPGTAGSTGVLTARQVGRPAPQRRRGASTILGRLQSWAKDAAGALALLALLLAGARAYVSAEHTLNFWDYAVYREIASKAAVAIHGSAGEAVHLVEGSFGDDYNGLFALPLAPILLAFGDTRLTFELALTAVYLCPFLLLVGAVGARVLRGPPRTVFWTTVGVALLVPMTWAPTLRGYPDAGGAALVLVALLALLRDIELRRWRTPLLIGACLGLAVVFRRHYAYAAVSFYLAAALQGIVQSVARHQSSKLALLAIGRRGLLLTVSGLALVATVAGVAWELARAILTVDYNALYRSYQFPPLGVVLWYLPTYGGLTLLAAIGGLGAALKGSFARRSQIRLVALFGATTAAVWCFVVRQGGSQYTYQLTPVVVIGLVGLVHASLRMPRPLVRRGALSSLLAMLAATAVLGLSPSGVASDGVVPYLLVDNWGPRTRDDYSEIVQLVDSLRARARPDDGIFVAASSRRLNPDLLRRAERRFHGRKDARLRILQAPAIDSRDPYPLRLLLEAEYVVTARPCQRHLPAGSQRVVQVVCDLFDQGQGLARDFVARSGPFRLVDGTTALVWKRRRPTSLVRALETLAFIRRRFPSPPLTQADWVVANRRFTSWLSRNKDGSTYWAAHPAERDVWPSTAAAYIGPSAGPIEVSGTVRFLDPRCPGAALVLSSVDAAGRLRPLAETSMRPGDDAGFSVRVPHPASGTLVLRVLSYAPGASIDHCLLILDPIESHPSAS